jgi:glycosyltransferase involved in cell wall biosynthesis
MKLLNVNVVLDAVVGGGTAERTFQMSRFLARGGIDCHILTLDVGLDESRRRSVCPAEVIALRCLMRRFYLFALPEPRIAALVRDADVVHLMGHWTLLNALVAAECRRQRKPYVVCPAGALPLFGRSRLLKKTYNQLAGRAAMTGAAAHVAIATNEFAQFAAYGIDSGRITLIPNGIDPDDFRDDDTAAFRDTFGLPQAPFILFLGRLAPIKGPDLLLEAYAALAKTRADIHLVYAGPDGGLLSDLRAAVARSNLTQRVHFIGAIGGSDKSRACHAAELLAVPSRQEAMSIVALEAGICGTPVLLTDRCGFDSVESSGGGRVVAADPGALHEALRSMLATPDRLSAMGNALRRLVRDRYLWPAVAAQYRALFERILNGDHPS